MNSKQKIKGLISIQGANSQKIADSLGITVAAARNKLSRNSWSINDLINLATGLGVNLAFIDDAGRVVISFNSNDAIKKENKKRNKTDLQ